MQFIPLYLLKKCLGTALSKNLKISEFFLVLSTFNLQLVIFLENIEGWASSFSRISKALSS